MMRAIDAVHAAFASGTGPQSAGAVPARAAKAETKVTSRSRTAQDSLMLKHPQVRPSFNIQLHISDCRVLSALCMQGYVLDGWPDQMSAAVALEHFSTGLDLEREAALHMRAPRMAPPPHGRLPNLARPLSSGDCTALTCGIAPGH